MIALLLVSLASDVAAHVAKPVPPILSIPAIGRDWMDAPDPIDGLDDPNPWPRADASDAGLDDMIHAERALVSPVPSASVTGTARIDEHLLRAVRKVGGDYIVVPLLTLHLDRPHGDR